MVGTLLFLTDESRESAFEPHGRSWTNVPTSGADLSMVLAKLGRLTVKGHRAGRGRGCVAVGKACWQTLL